MPNITVYDPPMCCPTGVCGPTVDPKLARFSSDLDWLKGQGVEVRRYNLSQQPKAFIDSAPIKALLHSEGEGCLPVIMLDDQVVSKQAYPTRAQLAAWAGIRVSGLAAVSVVEAECCPPASDGSKCC
jgi:hypothetical protein